MLVAVAVVVLVVVVDETKLGERGVVVAVVVVVVVVEEVIVEAARGVIEESDLTMGRDTDVVLLPANLGVSSPRNGIRASRSYVGCCCCSGDESSL